MKREFILTPEREDFIQTEDITTSLLENIPDNLFTKKKLFSHTTLLTYVNND